MRFIKETLEFFDAKTNKVVKKKSHKIEMENPGFMDDEQFFEECVKGFLARRKKARGPMDQVNCEKVSSEKSIIIIHPVVIFEYPQRWIYELI